MEANVKEVKKNEEDLKLERLIDSRDKLRIIHELRWNLNTIFSDIGDTSDYIEANEALNELERTVWKYIIEGRLE